jgi:hypothetical protein
MNTILETGISLVLIFFIFSTVTYIIQELIAVNLQFRGKMLWKSMSQLFDGFNLEGRSKLMKALPESVAPITDDFYSHPQIQSLHKNLKKLPTYIPAANFALAVMHMVAERAPNKQNKLFEDFQAGLQTFVNSNGNLYDVLKNLLSTSSDIKELQKKIEDWFNNYMQRVTGWYESHTVLTVRLIALALTLIFNINVIKIGKTIYNNGQLRSSLVAIAEGVADNPQPITQFYTNTFAIENADKDSVYKKGIADAGTDTPVLKAIQKERDSVMAALAKKYTDKNISAIRSLTATFDTTGLPLGWKGNFWNGDFLKIEIQEKEGNSKFTNILLLILGWLIGAGCISMGAPFWFDILGKLVNVRRSGVKPDS